MDSTVSIGYSSLHLEEDSPTPAGADSAYRRSLYLGLLDLLVYLLRVVRSFDADLFTVILVAMLLGLVPSLILITNTGSITGVGLRSTLMSWSGVSIVGLRNSGDWQIPILNCDLDS
jgi:hypothetical protein